MADLLRERARRVIAVSPIVDGQALKGPAAKIMSELGLSVSAAGWMQWMADRYPDLIDVWVWDERDHELAVTTRATHRNILVTDTVMLERDPVNHPVYQVRSTAGITVRISSILACAGHSRLQLDCRIAPLQGVHDQAGLMSKRDETRLSKVRKRNEKVLFDD